MPNTTVGIILTRQKDELLVEFATYGMSSQLLSPNTNCTCPMKRNWAPNWNKFCWNNEHGWFLGGGEIVNSYVEKDDGSYKLRKQLPLLIILWMDKVSREEGACQPCSKHFVCIEMDLVKIFEVA